jgi:multidrug efflux pump subunit AcrA (membrane-fusion protein)
MKKDRRWLWVILGVIIVLLAVWIFVRWSNRGVISIKTTVVYRGPIEALVSVSGMVDAPVYELSPKLGGKIINLRVKEGDRVKGGMTLADFDDTTRIVAPDDGLVAKVNYRPGETVVPGAQPAIVVVNYNQSWVEAQIDEIDIASVKIGDRVKITSDVYPDKIYEGEIYWIAPVAELRKVGGRVKMDEESYVFVCKIKFLGPHDELKVNMSVNVDIATKKSDNALIVPREAVVSKDDSTLVYAVKNNRVYETKLGIGIRSYTSVEAVSGLSEGDVLAVSNVVKLKDNGRVKIER